MTPQWGDGQEIILADIGKISSELGAYVQALLVMLNGDRHAGFSAKREAELARSLAPLVAGIAMRSEARMDAERRYQRPILRALIGAAAGDWMLGTELAELCDVGEQDETAWAFAIADMLRADLIEPQREKFRGPGGPPPRTSYRVTETGRKYFGVDNELTAAPADPGGE